MKEHVASRLPDPDGTDVRMTGWRHCEICDVTVGVVVYGAFQPTAAYGTIAKTGGYRCKKHIPFKKKQPPRTS